MPDPLFSHLIPSNPQQTHFSLNSSLVANYKIFHFHDLLLEMEYVIQGIMETLGGPSVSMNQCHLILLTFIIYVTQFNVNMVN